MAAKNNRIICGAVNRQRNNKLNVPYGEATYHAEINCLRLLENCDRVTLYIVRLGRAGTPLPSRPCKRCMKEIRETTIKEIVYLSQFGKTVKERL